MFAECPRCGNSFALKDPRPGRYSTRCPSCKEALVVSISEDPGRQPEVGLVSTAEETLTLEPTPAPGSPGKEPSQAGSRGLTIPTESAETVRPRLVVTSRSSPTAPAESQPGPPSRQNAVASSSGRLPAFVDGYRVVRELGRGGLGVAYLGKQLSCDRQVALKLVKRDWARNAIFAARFIRDVSAAALLHHHNIVQILDFGESGGTFYVCMEYVDGQTLADLVEGGTPVEPDAAAGYILQAARGLKYAHEHGLIHHDIKPENLFLDRAGVVKVADLGLVMTPAAAEAEAASGAETNLRGARTRARGPGVGEDPGPTVTVALGSPLFMAPEQTSDGRKADARSDIYALGCVLYNLVTGRPPFEASSAVDLVAMHQNEPLPPPEKSNPRVSRGLSDLILKMTAKRPSERFSSLDGVISALETLQRIPTGGVVGLSDDDAAKLTECVDRFNAAPSVRKRRLILGGAAAVCTLLVLLSVLGGQWFLAGGLLGLGLTSAIGVFIARGFAEKTSLYCKTMGLIFSARPVDWLVGLAVIAVGAMLLVVFHLLWAWIAFGVLAVVAAAAFRNMIEKPLVEERREPLATAESMIRGLRFIGLDEETIQRIVCQYGGDRWEEFFETLFGYEALRTARVRWGGRDLGSLWRRFGVWRDPVVDWIDARQRAQRAAREFPLIRKVEEKGLEALGVNTLTARRRAKRVAEALVAMITDLRATSAPGSADTTESFAIAKVLQHAADKPDEVLSEHAPEPSAPRFGAILNVLFSSRVRFLAGAALVFGCLLWIDQTKIITSEQVREAATKVKEVATKAVESKDASAVRELKAEYLIDKEAITRAKEAFDKGSRPLELPGLPAFIGRRFDGFNAGVAGLLLIFSAFYRSPKMNLFGTLSGAIAWLGPAFGFSATGLGDLRLISMGAGLAVLVVGMVLARRGQGA